MTCDACKTLGPDSAPHPGLRFVWTGKIGGAGTALLEVDDFICDWCGAKWNHSARGWFDGLRVSPPWVK